MSIHAGEIPLEKFTEQASKYLGGFDQIVETYRFWAGEWLEAGALDTILEGVSSWHRKQIQQVFAPRRPTAYEVYNAATFYATHKTRSYRIAFDLLERINRGFQKRFPAAIKVPPDDASGPQEPTVALSASHDPDAARAMA